MKPTRLFLLALITSTIVASSAIARPTDVRTHSAARASSSTMRTSTNHWGNPSRRHHRHYRHYRHHRSPIFFGGGFGYPFGSGYPYYGYYPYRYYSAPREVYQAAISDRSIVIAVQRRLARAGYYRGAVDGVLGNGTRGAIRSYERAHRLRVDGVIDQRLLATMGLA